MVCVGIDVAKDKHDCFIISSEGEILADVFTIPNNAEGFDTLLQAIRRSTRPEDKIKVGLEATGHYSYNILGFLLDKGLPTYVINPLHTNLYRKSLSLRKTKTDRVDARTIAAMLMSDVDLKSYFHFIFRAGAAANSLQKPVKALRVVWDGEYICQNFTFRVEDKAVMLVLGNIDSHTNHNEIPPMCLFDAGSTGRFTLVTLFHINRLAVSN